MRDKPYSLEDFKSATRAETEAELVFTGGLAEVGSGTGASRTVTVSNVITSGTISSGATFTITVPTNTAKSLKLQLTGLGHTHTAATDLNVVIKNSEGDSQVKTVATTSNTITSSATIFNGTKFDAELILSNEKQPIGFVNGVARTTLGTRSWLNCLYRNNVYTCSGSNGTTSHQVMNSTDHGVTWTNNTSYTGTNTSTIGQSRLMYNSVDGKIWAFLPEGKYASSSDDGITWTAISSGHSTSHYNLFDAYHNGVGFGILGTNGSGSDRISYSTDGTTIANIYTPSFVMGFSSLITYSSTNSTWIIVDNLNDIYTSTDNLATTTLTNSSFYLIQAIHYSTVSNLYYLVGRSVVGDNTTLYTSSNLTSWTALRDLATAASVTGVGTIDSKYNFTMQVVNGVEIIAVNIGDSAGNIDKTLVSMDNGTTWFLYAASTSYSAEAIAIGNGKVFNCGNHSASSLDVVTIDIMPQSKHMSSKLWINSSASANTTLTAVNNAINVGGVTTAGSTTTLESVNSTTAITLSFATGNISTGGKYILIGEY